MITLLTLALLQNPLSDFHLTERAANTFTHNRQVDQAIAADKDGNLLMVWGSRRQEVGTFGVFGAWLDPFGRPLGTELHINTTVQDNQLRPSAAFAPDGSAWVVWQSNAQDGDGFGVYARRLTLQENILEDGSTRTELLPKGDEIRVNQERSGDQIRPVLEFSSNGSAFVAWEDWSTGISQIKVRSFSQDGTPLCDEFLIAPNQNLRQTLPSIAPLAGERFAAVWSTSDSETGTPQGLQSRLVNLNMPLGSITRVDDQEEAGIEPSISSNAKDRYAIAWMSQAEGFGYGSWFRIFDSEKGALTEGAHVDAGGAGWRTGASVAMRPDGAFAIAYSNNKGKPPIAEPRRPHSDIDIRVQLFDRNGKSTSEGFRANKRTVEEQTLQTGLNTRHTLWTGKGQLAFAWHGNAEGDRRAAGLTLYAPKTLAKASIPEIEPVAAAQSITMEQVYDTEIRPDWDPNWRPEPLNPATPRGGLGGFTAFNSTGWNPPDPNLAVGRDHIVGVVNSQIEFYKKDGAQLYSKSLSGGNGFFGNNISGGSAGSFVFDPIAVYSTHHDRFVVAAAEDTNNTSYICVGISDDSDPTGTWHTYRITASSCGFLDFPNLGIDENAVYVSGDCFSGGGNDVYIFPLAPMLTGSAMSPTKMDMSSGLLSLGCMKNYDTNMDVQYFVSTWAGSNSQLSFYAITDPLTNPTVHSKAVSVQVYRSPPGADQLGTSNKADTIDNRIKHGVYRNGRMWFCFNVGAGSGNNTARVRWYEFDMQGWPNSGQNPIEIQSGTLNYGNGEHNWFGDIHVDDAGNATIAYHRSSLSQYIEIEYVTRMAGDPAGTMSAEDTLQTSTQPETGSRWGDYSGVEEDPAQPGTFWNHHEYRTSSWRTWMGHFATVVNPILSQTALFRGFPASLTLEYANPNELVYFLWSPSGSGAGSCIPALGGLCLDILPPVNFNGTATANANGVASMTRTIPNTAPLITIWSQAVIQRGAGGVDSVKSNVTSSTIQ